MKLSKKRLLSYEYRQYKQIGVPDLSQNWLELFTPTIVGDLFEIMHSCSNNPQKAKYIEKALGYYGFKEVSLGTNIYVMHNPAYPGVVFKFALDDNGLADNFNDTILQDLIPRYARTLARHPSAIVSVQERKVVIADQDRMDTFRASILKTLNKLARDYLIVDLSPTNYHLNYGVERNGDWCFIDASDMYPLANMPDKIRCHKAIGYDDKKQRVKRCEGRLKYNADFSAIICTKCGAEYLPLEIRPDDKEDQGKMANAMSDGLTYDDRISMVKEEMRAIKEAAGTPESKEENSWKPVELTQPTPPRKRVFVDPADDTSDVLVLEPYPKPKEPDPAEEDDPEESGADDDAATDINFVLAYETPDSSDDKTEEDTEPGGGFDVVNYNGHNEDDAGIYLHLTGSDPMVSLENCSIPIYLVNGENQEVTVLLSSTQVCTLLKPLVQDVLEEYESFKDGVARLKEQIAGDRSSYELPEDPDGDDTESDDEDEDDE